MIHLVCSVKSSFLTAVTWKLSSYVILL